MWFRTASHRRMHAPTYVPESFMLLAYSWYQLAGPAESLAKIPYSAPVASFFRNVDVAVR